MKLNCDLGEGFGRWQLSSDADIDSKLMPHIHMANIACGFHASDPLTIAKTVNLAVKHQVEIGAHPSYPDLLGFGRRSMAMTADELTALLHYQIGALQGICVAHGTQVSYVKPHGALYNDMMKNIDIFTIICRALAQLNNSQLNTNQAKLGLAIAPYYLVMQALPDPSKYQQIAAQFQLKLAFEAFADRHYQDNGLLVPRVEANACLSDQQAIVNRCLQLAETGKLVSVNGKALDLAVDTLCVHGDHPSAIALVNQLFPLLSPSLDPKPSN